MQSTESYSEGIEKLRGWIDSADRVLVGAGAGLSTAAGMYLSGPRYEREFPDFIEKYHDPSMYAAGFREYSCPEEKWAYWSRMIMLDRYLFEDNGTYAMLRELLKGKDYFVITTNVDHCFQRFGFDKSRLFYTQGDYGLWQCSKPCRQWTYDNEAAVRRMYSEQRDMRVPSELVPRCPVCGRPMAMNLRCDDTFVQDEGWYRAAERYTRFARESMRGRTLYLELGVGYNTPGIIKYPFWEMTAGNPDSHYAAVSMGSCQMPDSIRGRSVGLDMDIRTVLEELTGTQGSPLQPASCSPIPSPQEHRGPDTGTAPAR